MIERWLAAIRDDPGRPPPDQVLVLAMLALRLDWKTGTGYTSDRQLGFDADAGARTVQRATRWAREHGYAVRSRRGHGLWRGGIAASEWKLSQPDTRDGLKAATQPDTRDGLKAATQPDTRDGLKAHATRQPKGRTTRQSRPYNPTPAQHHQESSTSSTKTSSRRTTRNRSRGRGAATTDDFDLSTITDPREMLARFGAAEDEAEFGIRLLARLTPDPAGYLRGKSGDPEAFMRWLRRELQLDGQDPEAGP